MLKKVIAIIMSAFLILLFGFWAIQESDFYNVYHLGIFFLDRSENYQRTVTSLDTAAVFTIDWSDIESNFGKEIYNDGQCTIEISNMISDNNGGYKIFFNAHGVYNYNQGRMVTAISYDPDSSSAVLKSTVGQATYIRERMYVAEKGANLDGDTFGYQVFPTSCYEQGELTITDAIKDNQNKVLLELVGLQDIAWHRK